MKYGFNNLFQHFPGSEVVPLRVRNLWTCAVTMARQMIHTYTSTMQSRTNHTHSTCNHTPTIHIATIHTSTIHKHMQSHTKHTYSTCNHTPSTYTAQTVTHTFRSTPVFPPNFVIIVNSIPTSLSTSSGHMKGWVCRHTCTHMHMS